MSDEFPELGSHYDDARYYDHAYARLPERRRQRVLLVSEGNRYLEAALLLDEYLSVDEIAPSKYVDALGYDVVIFDRFLPPAAPRAAAFYVMGQDVTLVSSAEETALDVFRVLADAGMLRPDHLPPPAHEFVTTGDPKEFERLARRFLGPEVVRALPEPVTA